MSIPKLRFPEFQDAGEWEEKKLGDVSIILRGGSPRPIENFLTTDSTGLNWLKIGDVDKNSKYVNQTQEKVIPAALSKTREVNPGDLILSNSMSFGRPYILKIKSCIHDGWIAITEINKNFYRDYLYYLITSPTSQIYFLNSAAGSGVQNLNADIIKLLPVLTPTLPEQQKIADCLSSLDELITAQTQKLETLKTHKKGLMQQLFPAEGETIPKLRFPEFRDAGEWEEKTICNLLTVGNGKDYKHLSKGDIPVYGTGGYMLSVNDYLYDGESVCIGRKGTIDKPILLSGKFWTVDTLFYTHSYKNCFPKFIYLWFQIIRWQDYNAASGVPSLSKATIDKIKILVPPLPEQQKIADCLSSLDELITAQSQKLETLKTHKKGLMQQLFPAID
jgi:type I restriction enzyme, S subunit